MYSHSLAPNLVCNIRSSRLSVIIIELPALSSDLDCVDAEPAESRGPLTAPGLKEPGTLVGRGVVSPGGFF